ncbi:uncharacterized protein LOC142367367 [Odontesthes bonariensis]|uniref:uncharacterized protein LOC142367367 n=1 Tax=Odontesthes bonariensis TaxID=219752 RepID=UPI003F585150
MQVLQSFSHRNSRDHINVHQTPGAETPGEDSSPIIVHHFKNQYRHLSGEELDDRIGESDAACCLDKITIHTISLDSENDCFHTPPESPSLPMHSGRILKRSCGEEGIWFGNLTCNLWMWQVIMTFHWSSSSQPAITDGPEYLLLCLTNRKRAALHRLLCRDSCCLRGMTTLTCAEEDVQESGKLSCGPVTTRSKEFSIEQRTCLIHVSIPCLFHLLLLTELFVHSSSRPTQSSSLCGMFGSMIHQVDQLKNFFKMHGLTDEEVINFAGVEHKLESLPSIQHTAAHFSSFKVNESLALLYVYAQSFRLHVSWLKTAKENASLPSQAVEGTSTHLLHLSNMIKTSLHQISEEVPQLTPPSFPAISATFDVLRFSVEISERLQVFCNWSKRMLRHFQRQSRCPKH